MATTETIGDVNYGAFPLSLNVLKNSRIGLWAFELDEGYPPRMYGDGAMMELIGVEGPATPEEVYHAWYDHIDPAHYDEVHEAVEKMSAGIHAEVQYPWHYSDGRTIIVRCGGVRNPNYTQGIRIEGVHRDVSELVHFEKEQQLLAQMEEAEKLIEGFASAYNVAYKVDLSSDTFIVLRMERDLSGNIGAFSRFSQVIDQFLTHVVYEPDREKMRQALRYETMRERLAAASVYTVEHRIVQDGVAVWHEMTVKALDENQVAIGFMDRNREILLDKLQEKMGEEFYALFSVDMDTGYYTVLKNNRFYSVGEVGHSAPFREVAAAFAGLLEGEEKTFFLGLGDADYVNREFANEDKRTYPYRAKFIAGNQWIAVTAYVIARHEDGTPSVLTVGFSRLNSMESERQELQLLLQENMQVIGGLASGYLALYYVNLSANTFRVYSLDQERLADTKQLLKQGTDVFVLLHTFVNSPAVHPDDRVFFSEMTAEGVRKRLRGKKKFSISFRRNYGQGYLWSVMDVVKYEPAEEEANIIAIGFSENDGEIRSEQTLASSLALLGREMSPNDAIHELMALVGNFYGADRVYIYEKEKDGQTIRNTYAWSVEESKAAKSILQGVPLEAIDHWIEAFRRKGFFYLDRADEITEQDRVLLERSGVSCFLAVPIMRGDEVVGIIGVDGPTKARENFHVLKTVATVAYSEILRRRESDEEHITLGKLTDTFVSVFYVDLTIDYIRAWKLEGVSPDHYGRGFSYIDSMDSYIRRGIAERDQQRFTEMTRPAYIQEQFRNTDRFSVEVTDVLTGQERNYLYDYVKVNEAGTQFVICCTDVTESLAREKERQAQLQAALLEAEEANRVITGQKQMLDYFVGSYASAYTVDLIGQTVKVLHLDEGRKAFFKHFKLGRTKADMARFIDEHIHPEDREMMQRMVDSSYVSDRLRRESGFTFTVREVFDGEVRTMRCVIIRGLDEYHIAIGFLDITEELRKEVEQYALMDGLTREYHTVWLVDGFGEHLVHLHHAAEQGTIVRAVELGIEKPTYDTTIILYINRYVHEDDRERVIEATRFETVARETPDMGTYVISYRRYINDEKDYDYHQLCFAKAVASDGTVNYVMAYRDADKMIREQIAQQERLQEALAAAKSASESKTRFLFNMSHDIRTPLNAVIGFTNMAKRDITATEKALPSLEKVQNASSMLLSMINDILDMSRIESGKVELKATKTDLSAMFQKIASILKDQEDSKRLTLRFQIEGLENRMVYADTGYLERILVNIISNAVKYTLDGGSVHVTLEELPSDTEGVGRYQYIVADTGIGMSEEFQARMFEEFAREESSTVSGIPGTGLGLPLAKKLVEIMGGSITCVSQKGVGSTFTIILPFALLSQEEISGEIGGADESQPIQLAGKRVLLVEDNELNREIAEDILQEAEILVETAADGKQALDLVAQRGSRYYDAILMDIQMPVMNGYEATKAIRQLPDGDSVPIIAVSANAFKEDMEKSLAIGMNAHIAKPIDVKELLKAMSRLAK